MKRPSSMTCRWRFIPGLEGVGIAGSGGTAGFVANYLEWHTLLATSYMTQLVSMVVEGVFQKFPTLKVRAGGRGRRLAAADHVAAGQELEGAALHHTLADAPAERNHSRPCPTHDAAGRRTG